MKSSDKEGNSLSSSEVANCNIQYDELFKEDLQKQIFMSQILKRRLENQESTIKSREENLNLLNGGLHVIL